MNLGNVPASIGSSYVGLCVKSMDSMLPAPISLVLKDGALPDFS